MLAYVISLIVILGLFKLYRIAYYKYENIDRMFPGPATVPILGNVLDFMGDTKKLYRKGMEFTNLYRRSFRVFIMNQLFIITIVPEDIEKILNNTVHIKKSSTYDGLIPWIGRGLLTSDGNKWRKNRKLLTPSFHFKILESFLDVFNSNGAVLCEQLEKHVGSNDIEIMEKVKLCALDNICETAMGVTINAQQNPDSDLTRAVKNMCHIAFKLIVMPWLKNEFILSLTNIGKERNAALKVLHSFTRSVIKNRIEQREERRRQGLNVNPLSEDETGVRKKTAFLDMLLDVVEGGELTIEELQDEVDTFMFEGHDTITSALSFCLYNLANHPQFQEKAYEEQREIYGDDATKAVTIDDAANMKYLEMVIKESLRLHPSVPSLGRYIEEDLPLDERATVPKGAQIAIIPIALHRNPAIWGEDAEKFNPDHFLPEVAAKRHPYAYIPFSAGPRNCIGMKFAMLEMKATLSKILRRFKLKPCYPQIEIDLVVEATLQSLTGVHISLERRG